MHSGVNLNIRLSVNFCKLLALFFFAEHLQVSVHQVVVLSLEYLVLGSKLLNEVSSRVRCIHNLNEILDVLVKHVLLGVVVVNGLKGIIVEGICAKQFDHLELALHLLDDVLLVVNLHSLLAQLLQHIVEHHILQVMVGGDL